jgi:hypothetical protein
MKEIYSEKSKLMVLLLTLPQIKFFMIGSTKTSTGLVKILELSRREHLTVTSIIPILVALQCHKYS